MFSKRGISTVLVVAIIIVGLGAGVAQAVPRAQSDTTGIAVPYAGRLTDEAGLPVPDGDYAFTFALYDTLAGGTPLWSEVQEGVAVTGGSFVVSLGRVNSIPEAVLAGGERWLEVAVRGQGTDSYTALSPRQALRSAAPSDSAVNQAAPCAHDHWGESWGESGTGVQFPGPFVALYGYSDVWAGVMGQSTANVAVYGISTDASGVRGDSTDGHGVHGESDNDDAGYFSSGSASYLDGDVALGGAVGSLVAHGTAASELYLSARGDVTVRLDADMDGTHNFNVKNGADFTVCWVEESGDWTCSGTKSAVVDTADYGRRKLYAVESPEVWLEDFGAATLADGWTVVTIDPLFAQTVNLEDYHVFLTPLGECNGLYVATKTATSFEVRELGGGTSDVAFDYRLIAKRLGYEDVRLAPVAEP